MKFKDKLRDSKQAIKGRFNDITLRFKSKAELDDKLLDAVIFGHKETAKKLQARGADPNAQQSLSICLAVSKQDMPMLLTLLTTGKASGSDEAPLRTAVTEGRVVMAYKLVEHGASFDAAYKIAFARGNKYECERFMRFREKHMKGLERVEKRVARKAEKKAAAGPKNG